MAAGAQLSAKLPLIKAGNLSFTCHRRNEIALVALELERSQGALKRALAEIKNSENRCETSLNAIPALAWSARPDGSAEFFNRCWVNYAGLYNLVTDIDDRKRGEGRRRLRGQSEGRYWVTRRALIRDVSNGKREVYLMQTLSFGRELSNWEFFIQRWEQEYPAFVSVFQALPANRFEYRPHPRSRSAGELVALLVSAQQSCIQLCKSRKSMYSGLRWQEPATFGGRDEMISTYERDHVSLANQLRALDDNGWNHQAWLIDGKEEILLKDTVGGLLWIALFDTVHHRGQLSTYIRPMGGKVPSIYGPSADDAGERR